MHIRLLLLMTSLGLTACGEEESSFPEEQPAGQRDSGYSGPTLRLDMLQVGSADASLTFIDTNTNRGATDATTFPSEMDGGTSADSEAPIIDAFVDQMCKFDWHLPFTIRIVPLPDYFLREGERIKGITRKGYFVHVFHVVHDRVPSACCQVCVDFVRNFPKHIHRGLFRR